MNYGTQTEVKMKGMLVFFVCLLLFLFSININHKSILTNVM